MENKKTLYLVTVDDDGSPEAVLAVFDDRKTAEAFIDRFKSPSESKIVILEKELNPVFYVDKTKDAYFVMLPYKGDVYDCYRVDDLEESNAAFSSGFHYACKNRTSMEKVLLFLNVLATSEKDAIKQGKAIRNNLVATGDWEKNWLAHQATVLSHQ